LRTPGFFASAGFEFNARPGAVRDSLAEALRERLATLSTGGEP
jgi:hypothetical protein